MLNDRSTSIRNAGEDVQFSLMLGVALVVAVIWLFLKSARATLIPAIALPISLVGTFAGCMRSDIPSTTSRCWP